MDRLLLFSKKLSITISVFIVLVTIFFVGFFFLGKDLINYYCASSKYITNLELPYVNMLQKYIDDRGLLVSECDELGEWLEENDITYIIVCDERNIIYSAVNAGNAICNYNALPDLHKMCQYLLPIHFADKELEVVLCADFTSKIYYSFTVVSVVLAVIVCILICFVTVRKTIGKMQAELELANQLEREARETKNKFVRSMAHDLRTPLTGLIAFAEIIKLENAQGSIRDDHIDVIIGKANDIKELTDQIFDYSLSDENIKISLDEPISAKYAIGDYLSEMVNLLNEKGFEVGFEYSDWEKDKILVCSTLLGRIFNNITSNVIKYADENENISISLYNEKNYVVLKIENSIKKNPMLSEKCGLGLESIYGIMIVMQGKFEYEKRENHFLTKCYFKKAAAPT